MAGLHLAALYLIATSLGIVPPLITKTEPIALGPEEVTPPEDPTVPLPKPRVYEPTVYVPEPVAPPIAPADSTNQIQAVANDDPPVVPPAIPVPEPQLIAVRVDSRHPLTQPVYPSTDIRQGNEGTAEIEVYVLPNGRVGDARIVKSAGSPTLDQSALDEAKRRWRLLPATRDGEPYAQWHRLKVTFNLKNR
ncbi:MAG TPA: TonB family protein [Steroidobacteraceae bacterium]